MKRDLKINFGQLRSILSSILHYHNALLNLENASNTFLELLKEQDSVGYERLSNDWDENIKTRIE